MITKLITLFFVVFSFGVRAQLAKTFWVFSEDEVQTYLKFEHELLTFGKVDVDDSISFLGYSIKGDTLNLTTLSNEKYCRSDKKASYLIHYENNNDLLSLELINDACERRRSFLEQGKFSLRSTSTSDDLNYLVISIIKEVIIVNGIRNPQMLYITDLDGSPIKSAVDKNRIELSALNKGQYILQVWDNGSLQWEKQFERD